VVGSAELTVSHAHAKTPRPSTIRTASAVSRRVALRTARA